MMHGHDRHLLPLLGVALASSGLADGVAAQEADFLFDRPNVTLGARVGYALPRAGSEIFDFTREQLTIEKSDFNALSFGAELAVRTTERVDVAVKLGYEKSDTRSEFRDWVDQDGLPIEQDTRFTRVPVSAGAKVYVLGRGRRVSRFAWIPERWAPYVGAGVGVIWYRFEQVGDFVDFETLDIFFDDFESTGTAAQAYLAAGLDVALGPRWIASIEASHSWASAEMGRDFVGFDDIDLAGFRALVGLSVRL